ncbi:MAG: PUA domain-containing protein [Beijerinckiaceae bacterium]
MWFGRVREGGFYLPGVKKIDGNFARGDCVVIRDEHGAEIGRGLANYGAGGGLRGLLSWNPAAKGLQACSGRASANQHKKVAKHFVIEI